MNSVLYEDYVKNKQTTCTFRSLYKRQTSSVILINTIDDVYMKKQKDRQMLKPNDFK